MTLRVGLTGGIGSGKSTIAQLFAGKGASIIDADVITRQLVEPGEVALTEIADILGKQFIAENGRLDRTKLRESIFENDGTRKLLEQILHPRVADVIERQVASLTGPYCVIVIPLLFEAGQECLVDRVLVVDTPEEIQISRVMERDRCSADKVRRIIENQLDRKSKLARADDVIVNDGNEAALEEQVNRLHDSYLQMSR